MYEHLLRKIREKIRQRDYVVTTHADEEMHEDGLTIWDVESAILSGEIIDRQKDQRSGEWKHVILGQAATGADLAVVAKLGYTQRVVLITVFLLEP